MLKPNPRPCLLATLTAACVLAAAGCRLAAPPTASVSFTTHIAPLLQQRCVACHGAEKAKGRYRVDTFAALLKPGSSDEPAVVPSRPDKSHLLRLLVDKNPDNRMPQDADALPAAEIALVRRWIAEGAKSDAPSPTAPISSLLPRPAYPPAPIRYAQPLPVTALAFNADGTELVASGYHEATFWNATNGTLLRRVGGLPERIHALAWQPGGKRLAVAGGAPGRSGEAVLLDAASSMAPRSLVVTRDALLCAAFSPDGRRLAVGGADKVLRVFEVGTGQESLKMEQHSDWVHSVAFSPDGRFLASASRDRTTRISNTTNGETVTTFRGHEAAVEFVAFSGDGRLVYSAGTDRKVRSSGLSETNKPAEFAKLDTSITGLARVGEFLFIALADGGVTQRRLGKRDEVRVFAGHADRVTAMAFHESSGRFAAGAHDGRVRVWNLADGKPLGEFTASPGFDGTAKK